MPKKIHTSKRAPRKFIRSQKNPARFQLAKDADIDYKNFPLLQRYLNDRGRIVPRRISDITSLTSAYFFLVMVNRLTIAASAAHRANRNAMTLIAREDWSIAFISSKQQLVVIIWRFHAGHLPAE